MNREYYKKLTCNIDIVYTCENFDAFFKEVKERKDRYSNTHDLVYEITNFKEEYTREKHKLVKKIMKNFDNIRFKYINKNLLIITDRFIDTDEPFGNEQLNYELNNIPTISKDSYLIEYQMDDTTDELDEAFSYAFLEENTIDFYEMSENLETINEKVANQELNKIVKILKNIKKGEGFLKINEDDVLINEY